MPGTLYVVATPIGNLEDLTLRARRVLGEVDLVAAEDTRRTGKLLAHYDLRKPMTSYREHNEARAAAELVARLEAGESIALVSDAGTPGISDPGARLVSEVRKKGLSVVPIPGPSAVTTAISASGFAADQFVFLGFPPAAGSARRLWFERLAGESRAMVLYESPHRIRRTLVQLQAELGIRTIAVFRELTKLHESSIICPIKELPEAVPERGEFVLVVGPTESSGTDKQPNTDLIVEVFSAISASDRFTRAKALELTAAAVGCGSSLVKRTIKKREFSVKRQRE